MCGKRVGVRPGVGCPCPPVRNNIVTPMSLVLNESVNLGHLRQFLGCYWPLYQFSKLSMSILDLVLSRSSEIGGKIPNNGGKKKNGTNAFFAYKSSKS